MRICCPHCQKLVEVQETTSAPMRCPHCQQLFRVANIVASCRSQAPTPTHLDIGGMTLQGRRERNEDAFLIRHLTWNEGASWYDTALLVVADGMGGYQAGEQAAQMTIRALGHALDFLFDGALTGWFRNVPAEQIAQTVGFALQDVNRQVFQRSQQQPQWQGMGATLVLAWVWLNRVLIFHVGDTRAYLYRGGKLQQLTKDQTLVARMVELGQLSPQEALCHPRRHEVAQALGKHAKIEPARHELQLAPGDWLILASDGLHADQDTDSLARLVHSFRGSARELAELLARSAEQAGGSDNITVIVAGYY